MSRATAALLLLPALVGATVWLVSVDRWLAFPYLSLEKCQPPVGIKLRPLIVVCCFVEYVFQWTIAYSIES